MSLSEEDIAYMQAHSDESMSPSIIAAATLGLIISVSGLLLRLLAHRKVNQRLRADDWWIVGAVCMDVVMKGIAYEAITMGFGKHVLFVPSDPYSLKKDAILGLISELLWIVVATPTKISILCLYNRLFKSKTLFHWSILIGFIVSAYSIAYGIALGFQTIPFRAQWTGEPAWTCNINVLIGTISALDVVTDVMIISSPIPQILKLNLNDQRKKELMGVFGVGAIVIVFGIVRTVYTSITPNTDVTYNTAKCEIWTLLQPSIGVFSACLPCMRPLLPKRLGGSTMVSGPTPYGMYGSRAAAKRRPTVDYEMFSQGKDGWRTDEENVGTYALATHESQRGESPTQGIRVDRNVEITYETNWLASPRKSAVNGSMKR